MLKLDEVTVGSIVRLSCGSPKLVIEALETDEDGDDVAHVLYSGPQGLERDTVSLMHMVWPRSQAEES